MARVETLPRRSKGALATAAFAAALTAAVPSGSASARDGEVQALYAASFMGIGIAKGSLSVKVERGAYAAKLHISTAGLARIVSSEESYIDAKGYVGRSLVPATYELMSRGDSVTQVSMALGGGNVRSLRAIPELIEREDRVPVTSAAKRHVVDPLSAAILPIVRDDKDVCDRTLPIFDGWTRYDIKLSYTGTEPVNVPGYKGDAIRCSARWVPVAGHREGTKSTEYMRDNRDLDVWFVPMAEGKVMLPSKISVKTMRGLLLVVATQFGDPAKLDKLEQAAN
ncbi:DUF3108 domain-containing protein [Pleomorphomonas koreensis]|uniref:DUF3108 domain-containing protein n=1 Tax=Pleomorphomonas koreensis TaxID=257440 RepID=UPI0004000992|nr:DUF3108 domain-containing protein [Pleomorphomonas koreensis]